MSHNPFGDPTLNPYDAPKQAGYDGQHDLPPQGRPTSATVFGVLNLVFGIIGALMVVGSIIVLMSNVGPNPLLDDPVYSAWAKVEVVVGTIFTIIMISGGVGLLQMKNYGRTLSIVWSVYKIIFTIIAAIMTFTFLMPIMVDNMNLPPNEKSAAAVGVGIGSVIGAIAWMIYPIVMLTFMMSPRLKAAFKQANDEVNPYRQMQKPGQF